MRAFASNRRLSFIALVLARLAAAFAAPVLLAQESSTVSGVAAPAAPFANFERAPTDAPTVQSSWRVVGSTLRPRVNDVSYATNGSGGCVYVTAGSATTVWNTPLWIPDGANVQYLRIYVNDTSASGCWLPAAWERRELVRLARQEPRQVRAHLQHLLPRVDLPARKPQWVI